MTGSNTNESSDVFHPCEHRSTHRWSNWFLPPREAVGSPDVAVLRPSECGVVHDSKGPSIMDKWDRRFLGLAKFVSGWSKDPSTRVGAVLVDDQRIVVGMGYNGFARGVDDNEERYNNRDLKYKLIVHAEVNAILTARERAKGATLYVYPSFSIPCICHDCCKTAIQAGVKEIVGLHPEPEYAERAKRWQESIDLARQMCEEAGVKYRGV
jgi:dCMP deaminase